MGQVLHGSATTTHAVRALIQRSKASNAALSRELGINVKTVAKWRRRDSVEYAAMGPKVVRSTVLTAEEEEAIVAFRRHTLLPLDDCLYALQATIPHLKSAPRCTDACSATASVGCRMWKATSPRRPFGAILSDTSMLALGRDPGIDIAEVRTEAGKLHLFVAIDRTSKFAFAQLHQAANVKTAAGFLPALVQAVPYKIHTGLTDNGIQFGDAIQHRSGPTARYRVHMFDKVCLEHGIEHRFTKPNHPWTNGQSPPSGLTRRVERMNQQLRAHLCAFLGAYNFAQRLKTLKGITPYEAICNAWVCEPERFLRDPTQLISGLNT